MQVTDRATADSGVWRSPSPLPGPFLTVTVNACKSGELLVYWQSSINIAPPPPSQPPDAILAIGQAATFQTGGPPFQTVYLCDSLGGSFDVLISGSNVPIAASAAPPAVVPSPVARQFTIPSGAGYVTAVPSPLPIPAGVFSVLIALRQPMTAQTLVVTGADSTTVYYQGPLIGGSGAGAYAIVPVSAVLDPNGVTVAFQKGVNVVGPGAGSFMPLLTPYVPVSAPLTVSLIGNASTDAVFTKSVGGLAAPVNQVLPASSATQIIVGTCRVRSVSLTFTAGNNTTQWVNLQSFSGATLWQTLVVIGTGVDRPPIADLSRLRAQGGVSVVNSSGASINCYGTVLYDFDP